MANEDSVSEVNIPWVTADPAPGSAYVCVHPFSTTSYVFHRNDRFVVLDKTSKAPHGLRNVKGNWLVQAANGITVWSQFDLPVQLGWLVKE